MAAIPAPVRWMNSLRWNRRYRRLATSIRAARDLPSDDGPSGGGRPGRGRRAAVGAAPLLLVVALVAGLVTGCGGDDADRAGASEVQTPTAKPASDVTITATEYDFTTSSRTISSGRVRLTLDNRGDEVHQVQLARVEPGVTADTFVETFHNDGAAAAEKMVRWQTGINGVEPGERGTVVGDLEPGQYLMVCFVPGHDGVSHIDKKMVVPVEVVPGGEPVAEPVADGEIVIRDYAIDLPEGFDGTGTFAVHNTGPANHELIVMRYEDGKTLADLVAWNGAGSKGAAPVTFESGVATIPSGETSWVDLDLAPGRYIALCVIAGPGGQPHALMGMTAEFEIS